MKILEFISKCFDFVMELFFHKSRQQQDKVTSAQNKQEVQEKIEKVAAAAENEKTKEQAVEDMRKLISE